MAQTIDVYRAVEGGDRKLQNRSTYEGGLYTRLDFTVAGLESDKEYLIDLDVSQIKAAWVSLISGLNVSLETNDSGTPQETYAIDSDKPLIWSAGVPWTLFAGNITAFYFTNVVTTPAVGRCHFLLDATP